MIYIDTSALVPVLMPEARSMVVRAWFRRLNLGEAAVSAWTIVEFASALGIKVTIARGIGRSGRSRQRSVSAPRAKELEHYCPDAPRFLRCGATP